MASNCLTVEVPSKVETKSDIQRMKEAISIWLRKPNVVNRRLCGTSVIWQKTSVATTTTPCTLATDVLKELKTNIFDSQWQCSFDTVTAEDHRSYAELFTNVHCIVCTTLQSKMRLVGKYKTGGNSRPTNFLNESKLPTLNISTTLRKLFPRSLDKFHTTWELVLSITSAESGDMVIWFIPICAVSLDRIVKDDNGRQWLVHAAYGLQLLTSTHERNASIELLITNKFEDKSWPNGALCANLHWLEGVLLPKIKDWAESITIPTDDHQVERPRKVESLSLVSVEKYNKIYNELKQKYGSSLLQAWKENTDPQKFVYEDIGIAAYLVVLWEATSNSEKPSFIDLGCGNGLLVYILNKEGYSGKGIDLKRRGIWDFYGEDVCLEEGPLYPNKSSFEYDWIIGNHSDELTPWIPIIAARSSYSTNYFVLPCCFHDFCGKFNRNTPHRPQYRTYLDYVRETGIACGFDVEEDSLRIPSTKRICHVGRRRTYTKENHGEIITRLQDYLTLQNCPLRLSDTTSHAEDPNLCNLKDSNTYIPRESKAKVRNCTLLEKTLKYEIVNKVAFTLLNLERSIKPEATTSNSELRTSNGSLLNDWNPGGSMPLSDVVDLFDKGTLSQLKSQCGGLQTLLRNHGHIFKVVQGQVVLRNFRDPILAKKQPNRRMPPQKTTENNLKTKLCWFHCNHPQGCVFLSMECKFAHGQEELRTPGER